MDHFSSAYANLPFRVCVPARNEAQRIGRLLHALAEQDIGKKIHVIISLNNTTDDTAKVVEDFKKKDLARLIIEFDDHVFPPDLAHAGSARRRVMDIGLQQLKSAENGVLLTTDADARPPQNWVSANLKAINNGADIVGGRLVIDDREPLPIDVVALQRLWDRYWDKVRSIEDELDPRSWDPPPRHGDHTGGSLAITTRAYIACGGVPIIPTGEDRALVEAALGLGSCLVHPIDVWTRVSPRQDGRAMGGMAEAMAKLHHAAVSGYAPMVPSLAQWRCRAEWRRKIRLEMGQEFSIVQQERELPPMTDDVALTKIDFLE